MAKEISNIDDVIDSRDVIARIEELEEMADACSNCGEAANGERTNHAPDADVDVIAECSGFEILADENELAELKILEALADECEGYGDWKYGATLVNDDYFEEFARQEARETVNGDFDRWPFTCIDWSKAADELKQDYTEVDFDGQSFWLRS